MPYKTFNNWLFDGNLKSEIPNKNELLKYNSPITVTYVINLFLLNGKLNYFLNEYFNNLGLRYLDKEEFFRFVKKCVIDFRVNRKSIPYFGSYIRQSNLFEKFRKKLPILKSNDISLLCDIVDKSDDKEIIYSSLGLDKPIKTKIKFKQKNKEKEIITLEDLMINFKTMRVEESIPPPSTDKKQ